MPGSRRSVSYPRACSFSPSGGSPEPDIVAPRRKLRMWWSTTVHQLFQELVPLGNMNRRGFLENPEECLRLLRPGCPAQDPRRSCIDDRRDAGRAECGLSASSMCRCRSARFIRHLTGQRWKVGHFLLDRRLSDRSPLRRAMHDCKPTARINRATVQRATSWPSRFSCRQTLRTP